jgi:TetR/AcrR family transcriptional repressor of nem operon
MARPPSFDKQQVLEAVERQFRKTGYAGTSLDDITAATGLGRGSLYAAFGDKQHLFLQALTDYCERSEAAVLASLAGPDDGALDRLRGYLTGAVRFLYEDEDQLGCMAGRFAVELCGQDEAAAARIKQDQNVLRSALMECVAAAQRHGDLDPAVDPLEIGCLLLTISRGIEVVTKAGVEIVEMEAVADRAFACLPLTRKARRALREPTEPASEKTAVSEKTPV